MSGVNSTEGARDIARVRAKFSGVALYQLSVTADSRAKVAATFRRQGFVVVEHDQHIGHAELIGA